VAVRLTTMQRMRHPDKCWTAWYLPTYISQKIINDKVSENEYPSIARLYFHATLYTAEIHACMEIYLPMNSGEHWFCLKVDMVLQRIYILDSLPGSNERKQMAITLVKQ